MAGWGTRNRTGAVLIIEDDAELRGLMAGAFRRRDYQVTECIDVILTTAFPSDDTRETARKLGVLALFEKPFDPVALVCKVGRLLGRHPGEAA